MDKHQDKKNEIIQTAFREWGKTLFINTSLSTLAQKLKISKPAIFRYFKSKDELLSEMKALFIKDYLNLYMEIFTEIQQTNFADSVKIFMNKVFSFFIFYPYYFHFFSSPLIKSSILKEKEFIENQDKCYLIFQDKIGGSDFIGKDEVFTFLRYILSVGIFVIFSCYHKEVKYQKDFEENKIDTNETLSIMYNIVSNGFYNTKKKLNIDFEKIEKESEVEDSEIPVRDKIFEAITEVVAEVGIIDASMEKIATKAGMKKSSLYFHFKNRDDMFESLLLNEIVIMKDIILKRIEKYDTFEEKVYSAMVSSFFYLTKDLRILCYFNWIQFQRIKFKTVKKGEKKFEEIARVINAHIYKALEDNIIKSNGYDAKDISALINIQIIKEIVIKYEMFGKFNDSDLTDLRTIFKLFLFGINKN